MRLIGVLLLILGGAIAYGGIAKGLTITQMIADAKQLL